MIVKWQNLRRENAELRKGATHVYGELKHRQETLAQATGNLVVAAGQLEAKQDKKIAR